MSITSAARETRLSANPTATEASVFIEHGATIIDVDPFDLPEWLGDREVVWRADAGLRTGHHVRGRLTADGADDLVCDLLAVDEAYPQPVVDDASRLRVHQA